MSFPKCLIGNPVFVKSMAYGCPTEPFGHDIWTFARGSKVFSFGNKGFPLWTVVRLQDLGYREKKL